MSFGTQPIGSSVFGENPAEYFAVLGTVSPAVGALGATFEAARWVALTVMATIPDGVPIVWAKIGTSPHTWHLVYDGASFGPLWADHCTVTQSGSTYTFSLLPTGGWWGDVEISAGEYREAS